MNCSGPCPRRSWSAGRPIASGPRTADSAAVHATVAAGLLEPWHGGLDQAVTANSRLPVVVIGRACRSGLTITSCPIVGSSGS